MKFTRLLLFFLLFIPTIARAQDKISADDYKRAMFFLFDSLNNKKVYNLGIRAHWFPDSSGLWYVHHSPRSKKYLQVRLPGLQQEELFDHQRLAEILSDSLGKELNPDDLPLSAVEYRSRDKLLIQTAKKTYLLDRKSYSLQIPEKERAENSMEETSPDSSWIAFQKDYNLFIRSTGDSTVRQLSKSGYSGYEYASWYGWYDIMEGGKR